MRAEQLIATHGNTDFDALASLLAARHLYPGAVACLQGSLNRNVREFARLHQEELGLVDVGALELDAVRRLVVVETTSESRLGELEPLVHDPGVEKAVFDHHGAAPAWAGRDAVVLSEDGALTTTLVGILAEREIAVTPLEATAFALGIHEDTGSLTYPSATQRDAEALGWCLRHGARQELVAHFLHLPLAESERALLHAVLDAAGSVDAGGVEVLVAAVPWHEYVDGVSTIAHKVVELTDARALALLVEMDGRVVCVTRSRTPDLDAGALAAALGGGGHEGAASATFRGSLDEAREQLLAHAAAAVRPAPSARDVMSSPARTVAPDDTVARAMALCQRHRQSGILVAEEGDRLVGVVAREDLDKAIGHDLAHAPVKAVMSSSPATCDESTPLPELRTLLLAAPGGRVAVLRDGRLAGVVARTDVIEALEQPPAEPRAHASIAADLRSIARLRPLWDAVALCAEGYEGVHVVGGTVRDILLGEPGFDVDVVVEGDAIGLARALAGALGGRVRAHEKFGTAVVVYGDGERVDVVTARNEFYDAPGALPSVEHASLREDLFRRDFTVNAMAASLRGEDFGLLVDPFGGRADLEARTLRVLHNLSFIDDPTRIFRAVRYQARYGLVLEEHTRRLARACIEMGLVGDLSSARLRDELVALLEEPAAPGALTLLGELGLGRAVHERLAADAEGAALLERALGLRDRYGLDVPAWRIGLAVLARHMTGEEALTWLDRLKVRRRDAERIAAAAAAGPRIVDRLAGGAVEPADVAAAADPYGPDAPLMALALADLEPLHHYFGRLRDVRLEIGGADLAGLGLRESPRVGEILGELRRRKLNGELDGREAELAAAAALIAGP